ncbi:glycosyltransferase [Fibrobacter sp. UWB3]|uniref:glycosyltransferase n=1 Tax=Fibrobacter sp. UWB3 TaxID=1964357 RepID=UPI000B51FECF|nr:glycosyltransferase [Fibrobacter sp. UWB3]OWV20745.1 glycosyl transferase family 1 [Fibrobacter sp. UWB3]
MKVLVIGSVYPRFQEDAEVPWLRTSIAHLKKAGVEIQVLAPAYKGLKSHDIDGTHVNRFRYAPAAWEILTHEEGAPSKMASKPWLQLLAIPYIINGFFQCIRICRKWRPDVIHAHWPFPHAYIALGAAKLFKIPLVLNFHGAELLLIRKKKWVKPLLKFAIGQAQAIFANSSFTAGKIKALRNVNVEWSPYGTTLEDNKDESGVILSETKDPVTIVPHPVNGKFKILFVGRHIERKGICYLIEAAKHLPRDKFEIRIVGVGDLTEQLKAQAEAMQSVILNPGTESGINSSEGSSQGNQPANIIFTGKLSPEALANEYKTANVFTLPAIVDHKGDTEGLGVVLIEAMELGLPIVASNVGGIPDVVVDGESGILVPEKDPVALADAFKCLEADPTLIQKLLAGARKRIEECFTWDGIIERQIEVYKRLQQ